ncbi:MAG: hypothetical protein ACFCUU_16620, partial [Cyclobacteriaceae bacterium]
QLRFRAPEAIYEITLKKAAEFGAVYVPIKNTFEQNSALKPDESLFLEHLHPNIAGHHLLADCFYNKLIDMELKAMKINAMDFKPVAFEKASVSFPITKVDSLYGEYGTLILKQNWPFNEPLPDENTNTKSFEEALAGGMAVKQISWDAAMEKLYKHYHQNENLTDALLVSETVALMYPHHDLLQMKAGQLAFRLSNWEKSLKYFRTAHRINPDKEKAKRIVQVLFKMNELQSSIPYLMEIISSDERGQVFREVKIAVQEILEIEEQLDHSKVGKATRNKLDTMNKLAINYSLIGNLEKAREIVENILKQEPQNLQSQHILKEINLRINH